MESGPDSTTTGQLFDFNMIFLLIVTIFYLGRTWMDVFILTVNCRDWMRKKRLSPTDRILTLQGSIRLCFGYMTTLWFFLVKFCPWITQISYASKAFIFFFWYATSYNVWLTASLCSYYCVKIADFSHPFFIHLKLRFSTGPGWTWILGSAVVSLVICLPLEDSEMEIEGKGNFSNFFQNKNGTDGYTMTAIRVQHALLIFGYVAAFSICATSAVLLLFSLWRHRQRMRGSREGYRSPQTNAHLQAVITILSLLINHVIIFVSVQLLLSIGSKGHDSTVRLGAAVVLYICLAIETLISVWGNKKLRDKLRKSLCFARCRECVS